MKSCPHCHKSYDDGSLGFCLDDGTPLVSLAQANPSIAATRPLEAAAAGGGHSAASIAPTRPIGGDPAVAGTNVEFPPRVNPVDEGAQVGEYVIGRKIGEGGMGVIYSGVHPIIGKKVAIKVLNSEMASNPDIVGRFIQEAKSVNQIGHRNIVDIFSFGRLSDGRHYFAMEFLEGQSLSSRLAAEIRVGWTEAISIWLQVASAIEAAHQQGIVHRDLKPDNIFISPTADGPFVKVLDFGIAKLLGDTPGLSKTSTGVPIGTPAYMSPEQARGAQINLRTDLYAFGIILFETISGRPPFLHHNTFIALLTAHLSEPPPPLPTLADVHPELNALVEKLLAKDPENRPRDMAEVRAELSRLRDLAIQERYPLYAAKGELQGLMELAKADERQTVVRVAEDGATTVRAAVTPTPRRRSSGVALAIVVLLIAAGSAIGWNAMRHVAPPQPAPVLAAPVDTRPPPNIPSAQGIPPNMGRVIVSTNAIATKVFLDKSEKEKSEKPAAAGGMYLKVLVPANVDWVLRVEADTFKPVSMPLRISAGEESSLPVVMVPIDAPKTQHSHIGGATKPATVKPATASAPTEHHATNPNVIDPF